MRWIIVAAALLAVSACEEKQAAPSRFEAEVVPLLRLYCAACHLTGQEAGNMALVPLKAWDNLVNVKAVGAPNLLRVVPGKPDESYMIMKLENTHIEHGGTGAQMPLGQTPLAADQTALLRQWITDGAQK